MNTEPSDPLVDRIADLVDRAEQTDAEVEQTAEGCRLSFPGREIRVTEREGPAGTVWSFAVRADGAVVGKHGLYESVDALCADLRSVLAADVGYTVCCDG